MKKLVNGKVINIDNIELFELAAEGLALQNTAISATADGVDGTLESPVLKKYIKQYDAFFKSMPYPLYAIEQDIKYATLGNFIKSLSQDNITMWIDNGLCIRLNSETGMILKIVNNTWSICYCTDDKEDNTSMKLFEKSVGYKEYSWLLNKIKNKETTSNFYMEFMPDFVKACNGQPMVIKWELENILTFGNIPNRIELKENKVIDIQNDIEYSLDIYCNGTVQSDEVVQSWSLYGQGGKCTNRYKQVKTYGFDAYCKNIQDRGINAGKQEKCSLTGLHNLFMQLCGIKSSNDLSKFPNFYGILSDTNLVFIIDGRLYVAKSNRLGEPKDIAHGVELYSVEKNKIYFIKSKRVNNQISKDTLYSYNIVDGSIRMCKIIFSY